MPLALVTGGAVRVGRAIVVALAEAGYEVIIHARSSADAANTLARDLHAFGRKALVEIADLGTPDGPMEFSARVRRKHPRLDLLVNSAAAYAHTSFEDVTADAFDAMTNVNVRAPFFLTQGLLPSLRASESASIVNITDMAVTHAYTTSHFFSHYLATKAALEQLTRAWALELGPKIRVNAVAPGSVAMAGETTDDQRKDILQRVPLRREGSPEDVARAVVFLAQAPYITGQTLRVDGGLSIT